MNERTFYERPPHHHQYSSYSSYSARPQSQTDYLSTFGTLLAFVLFACFAYPLLQDPPSLSRILGVLHNMAARASFGLIRRPLPGFGSESGTALCSVFGLKSAATTLGTDTIQRGVSGIRSIVGAASGAAGSDAPAGLGNWDNSCYQNSVIQGLASIRALPSFLQRVVARSKTGDTEEGGGNMNEALLGMVERLNSGQHGGGHLWLPKELKTMSTWQQQDAQEYFSKILDKLDREALKVAKEDTLSRRKDCKLGLLPEPTSLTEEKEEGEKQKADENETETLKNPLEGMIAQRVACKRCGHSDGISLIPFNCLTVPLGTGTLYDIRDCLDAYTALEEIEGVQCPKCTLLSFRTKLQNMLDDKTAASETLRQQIQPRLAAVEAALSEDDFSDEGVARRCGIPKKQWVESTKTKQAVVARPPVGLVIHLNRSMFNEYTGAQTKNPASVQFPERFGLGPWMLGKTDAELKECWSMSPTESMLPPLDEDGVERVGVPGKGVEYELRAVVTHFGRHENGHYVAYRRYASPGNDEKEAKETWWRLSDEDVTAVEEEFVLRQGGVFMLFYERVEPELPLRDVEEVVPVMVVLPSIEEVASLPLPEPSEDEFALLQAEDEYVMATPPASWSQPGPSLSSPARPDESKPSQLPTPPPSTVDSASPPPEPEAPSNPTSTTGSELEAPEEAEAESELMDRVALELNRSTPSPDPSKVIKRMRTSSLMKDGGRGSSESLRLGGRMVSAS